MWATLRLCLVANYDLDSCPVWTCLLCFPPPFFGSIKHRRYGPLYSGRTLIVTIQHFNTSFCFFLTDVWNVSLEDAEEQTARDVLAELLAAELRQVSLPFQMRILWMVHSNLWLSWQQARARYRLSNGQQQRAPNEILLPAGILQSIARDILIASVDEPCGIR